MIRFPRSIAAGLGCTVLLLAAPANAAPVDGGHVIEVDLGRARGVRVWWPGRGQL